MHWYVLSESTGIATLCVSEQDARREAPAYDRLWPRAAPHIATQLARFEPLTGDTVESATIAMDAYMDRHPNAAHEDYVRVALEAVWPTPPNA